MSDTWLIFIPIDPDAVPTEDAAQATLLLLRSLAPNSQDVSATQADHRVFRDCGSNWSGVRCPACDADLGSWWSQAMDTAWQLKFAHLSVQTPCCDSATTLNDLHYVWPAGFSRFALEALNPGRGDTSSEEDRAIEQALGLRLRKIWRRI